jgi:hypothetical protein
MNSITSLTEAQLAGVSNVFFIEHRHVLEVPEPAAGVINRPVVLEPNYRFSVLAGTIYTPELATEPEPTQHGTIYKQLVEGWFAGDSPDVAAKFQRMNGRRFLVLLRFFDGSVACVGDQLAGLLFTARFGSGRKPAERKGYRWKFEGQTRLPAVNLVSAFQVEQEPLLQPSAGPSGNVTVKDTLGNILANAAPGSTVIIQPPANTGASTAFNWNRPITAPVPGLQGKVGGGITLQAGLENLLFEPLGPEAMLGASPTDFDFDDVPTVDVDLFYTARPRGASLEQITLDGQALALSSGGSATSSGDLTKTIPANVNRRFVLYMRDERDKVAQATVDITFWLRRFFFKSAVDLIALLDQDEEQAVSQAIRQATPGERSTSRQVAGQLQLAGEFVYHLVPATWGQVQLTVNGLANTDIQSRPFTFTTLTGYEHQAILTRTPKATATLSIAFT